MVMPSSGALGTATMDSGAGNDTFVFATNFGNDTVQDFDQAAGETLDISELGVTAGNFAGRVSITNEGGNALITIDDGEEPGGTITLLGHSAATIGIDDFTFA